MVIVSFRETFQKLFDFLGNSADALGLVKSNIVPGNPQSNLAMKSPTVAVFATPNGEYDSKENTIGIMDVAIFSTAKAENTIIGTISANVELADKVFTLLKRDFPLMSLSAPEELYTNTNNTVMLITGQLPYRRIE